MPAFAVLYRPLGLVVVGFVTAAVAATEGEATTVAVSAALAVAVALAVVVAVAMVLVLIVRLRRGWRRRLLRHVDRRGRRRGIGGGSGIVACDRRLVARDGV